MRLKGSFVCNRGTEILVHDNRLQAECLLIESFQLARLDYDICKGACFLSSLPRLKAQLLNNAIDAINVVAVDG